METVTIPNWFAYIAIFGWPLVCLGFFIKLPFEKAAIWSLLGAYILLPSGLELKVPPLPPLDKMGFTAIATALLCWMKGSQVARPRLSPLMIVLATGFILAPIFTSFDNSYELQTAGKSVPGFYPADGLKFAGRNILALLPLYIGYRFLSTERARSLLLKALPTIMLFYSLPMLFEVRMSPQLHRRVYGYFPSDAFAQQMRAGGFRPVVFFSHGLALALFTALALIATIILVRMKSRIFRLPTGAVVPYLGALLVTCKSLGPILYTVTFAPVVMLTRPRFWVQIACATSIVVCSYPLLRNHDLTPVQLVSNLAGAISTDRSASFGTRVANEQQLLAKANQKSFFGWGAWGRNRIFDQWTGKDVSITDGGWIILFGTFGWLGYLSFFGLMAAAEFRAFRAMDKEVTAANIVRGGLALLLAIYMIDSIPNATEVPLAFLLAGSVASMPRSLVARRLGASARGIRRESPAIVPQFETQP